MAKSSVTIAISGSYNGRAMAKAEEDLRRLRVRTASEMGGAAGAITDFGGKLGEAGGKVHNFGYGMEQVGSKATRALTVPIAAAAAACGAAAIEIDTSLTSVRKTVDGTEEQYNQLKEAAIEFSKTNAVSASQILDIQALGAQLGYSIDELQEFGEVVSGLDIATNMSAEEAATELAQFANIMGMSHDQTRNFGSTIVELGNNFATTEADISHMAMRIAGAGKSIGLTESDVLGLATALSSMGIEAEAGGTAISTIMSNIDKAVATNAGSVKTWAQTANMSVDEFTAAWGDDAVGALSAVLVGMDSATAAGGNMSQMLEDLGIDSIRQTDTMKRLANNSEFLGKAVETANRAWGENSALQAEVDNRNQSMAARFEMLKNKVTAVAEKVGTPLVNAALEFVDAAEPVLDVVSDAAEAFADMDEEDQKMVVGLVAAAAAFGPAAIGCGKVVQAVGTLTTKVGKGVQTFGGFVGSLRGTKAAADEGAAGMKDAAAAARSYEGGAMGASTASNLATRATQALTGAMKATAVGLVVGLVADLVGQFQAYCEHEKLVEEATGGLTSALTATADAAGDASPAVESMGDAVEGATMSAEECLRAQADLAGEIRESWGGVKSDAAMVDRYADTIERLTSKYGENGEKAQLSAREQAELKAAVEGLNGATESNYEITDLATGQLSESIDVIRRNAKAWEDNARAQAAQAALEGVYQQQMEVKRQLEDTNRALAESEEGIGFWLGEIPIAADPASVAFHELTQQKADLEAQTASLNESEQYFLDQMGNVVQEAPAAAEATDEMAVAMDESAASTDGATESMGALVDISEEYLKKVQDAVEESPALRDAMAENGWSVELLAAKLQNAGIKASDLASSIEELSSKTCNEFEKIEFASGTSLDAMLETLTYNTDATRNWSENVAALYETAGNDSERNYIKHIADMGVEYAPIVQQLLDDSSGKLSQLATQWDEATSTASSAVIGNAGLFSDGIVEQIEEAAPDVYDASCEMGGQIPAGTAQGIADGEGITHESVKNVADSVLGFFREAFEINSPSKATERMGHDLDAGLGVGITGGTGEPQSAMEAMGRAVLGKLSFLAPSARNTGSSAGQSLAGGLSSKYSAASAAGAGLASSAKGGLSGAPGQFNAVGATAAGSFSRGIGSASAYSAGSGLARTGKQGLESVSAYGAGRDFGRGFGNGMSGVDIWGAAYNVGMSALGAIKSALGIHSPSREAMAVGEFFGEGAILGMEKTVAGIEAEADKMSRAMELNPEPVSTPRPISARPGPAGPEPGAPVAAGGRPIVLNVTINVAAQSAEEGRQVGKSIGEELYNELVRLERASGR